MHSVQHGSNGPKKNPLIFAYGLLSYTIGVAGLLAIIFGMADIIPLGQTIVFTDSKIAAAIINFGLLSLFGLQHTIMARPKFKERLNSVIGAASERSTFVLATGIISLTMIALWQPMGGIVWQATSTTAKIISWSIFIFGWSYLLAATFAINHFDLFGLRQTWMAAKGQPYTSLKFKENWMYRFSRHPIMLGALIGLWSAPNMAGAHLTLAILFTVYVFIGIGFEERDLVANFGETYNAYKQRAGMFFTLPSFGDQRK